MGRKPKSRPSFFKVMIKDFTSHMHLPPYFVRKYGEILPENTKLRTSSGDTWNVELEKIDEEKYCLTRGWTKFAKDVGVKLGEFLVFWFDIGKSTFDVSIYGTKGCERRISASDFPIQGSDSFNRACINLNTPEVNNKRSRAYTVEKEAEESDDTQEQDYIPDEAHPQFKLLLKKHHRTVVTIRKEFAVAAGLTTKEAVVLQYLPKQHCWPVLLHRYPKLPWFRLDISRGWSEFRRTNGLVFGRTYLFEYIPDKNVIQIKLLNGKN
ncbi:hypothetical protein DH2020_037347 [Rehmannia glutinosa]|uniref:TF-B3 domain-containing protein n=1 Tax=Rehmannia glutinosa TaxID=99300 RepID=A0ABR0V2C8_REHGL